MTVEELKEMISKDDINKELVLSKLDEFANDAKNSYKRKDIEALKFKSAIKKLGYSSDEHSSVDTFIESMLSKSQHQALPSDKITLLESRLAEYETKVQASDKRESDAKIQSKLSSAIGSKLKGSKAIVENLMLKGVVKLVDGEVVFKGKTDDEFVLFDNGINALLEEHQDLLIVDQIRGGNIKPILSNNTDKTLSMESINKMSPEQIKENIDAIWKLAK